ncbi:MAG: chitinase [Bryobacteraceae bacterium]|nr:chitinase [Bryobacteraceae bacterium]
MCIKASVGQNGKNLSEDVKTVQLLLNLNSAAILPQPPPLNITGKMDEPTLSAIAQFQRDIVGAPVPDSRVDPGGATLLALQNGMPADFSQDKVAGIMINATADRVRRYYTFLVSQMKDNGIDTPLRMAHFLAQLGHESGEFQFSEEIASGQAYEGRVDLGNTRTGDGVRFKGRGLIQVTGRANYTSYGKDREIDYTGDDRTLLATDPKIAVDVSCWFWVTRGINALADKDDVLKVSVKINGRNKKTGLPNGFDDRKAKLARAKFFLKLNQNDPQPQP